MVSPRQTEEAGLVSFDAVFSKVESVGRSAAAQSHTVRSLRRMRIRIHPALPPLAIRGVTCLLIASCLAGKIANFCSISLADLFPAKSANLLYC